MINILPGSVDYSYIFVSAIAKNWGKLLAWLTIQNSDFTFDHILLARLSMLN